MEIKVKPEQLEQIAKNISAMQKHSQNIQQNLNQSMFSIQMQWQGATSQRFYGEYMRSTKLMEGYIHNLQETEKDLRRIAQKFRQTDQEYQKKQAEKVKKAPEKEKKEEKAWWEKARDEAAEFFGVNDAIRAFTGKDPVTGKELSTKERLIAAGWTLLNVIPVGKVLSTAGKVIKYGGKMVVEAVEKGGKALLDGAKKVPSKLKEGVSFVASKTKSLVNKVGDLWNKGKTAVKNTFVQAGKKVRHAIKTLTEYKWIPGGGEKGAGKGAGKGFEGLSGDARKIQTVVLDEKNLRIMSTKELRAFKNSMGNKGIKVIIDKKGTLFPKPNVAAMFDPQTGRIILRSEPRILDSFHESYHAEQWLDLGKPDYLTQSMLQREEFVYSTIMKNKNFFTKEEIYEAQRYIERCRTGEWPPIGWKGYD